MAKDKATGRKGAPEKYGFSDLEVGQSMMFAKAPGGSQSKQAMAALAHARRHGKTFKTQTMGPGVRITRTA